MIPPELLRVVKVIQTEGRMVLAKDSRGMGEWGIISRVLFQFCKRKRVVETDGVCTTMWIYIIH